MSTADLVLNQVQIIQLLKIYVIDQAVQESGQVEVLLDAQLSFNIKTVRVKTYPSEGARTLPAPRASLLVRAALADWCG